MKDSITMRQEITIFLNHFPPSCLAGGSAPQFHVLPVPVLLAHFTARG
jgi:hypothetical protein